MGKFAKRMGLSRTAEVEDDDAGDLRWDFLL
jgi:hypothetical protein